MVLLTAAALMFFSSGDMGYHNQAVTATVPHYRDVLKVGMSVAQVAEKIGPSCNISIHGIGQMDVYYINIGICLEFTESGRLERIVELRKKARSDHNN